VFGVLYGIEKCHVAQYIIVKYVINVQSDDNGRIITISNILLLTDKSFFCYYLCIQTIGGGFYMSKEKVKKAPNPDRLPVGKFFAWRASAFSMAANFIVMGYLTIYCTDTLKMPPALVGALLLASKLLDGVGELFAGYLVDNTKTRFGKGRPYELCLIGLWIFTGLLFSTPEFGMVGKSVWVVVCYTMVMSVFQTLFAAAQNPYMVRAFANKNVFVKLQSYGGIVGTLLTAIVSISFPMMMRRFATSPKGWSMLVIAYAVPLLLIGLIRFFTVKEVYDRDQGNTEKIKLSEAILMLRTNKYVWMLAGVTLIIQMMMGMNAAQYYFTYIVGDISKYGTLQALTIVLLLVMFVFPKFIKEFSISTLIGASAIFGLVGYLINFLAGSNMTILAIGFILTSLASLAPSYLVPIMVLDCATYNEWLGNKRMEGTLSSLNGFGTNLGSGIGSAIVGFFLGAAGYVGGAAVQTPEASFMIKSLYSFVPAAMYLLMFIIMRFFNLEKKIPQMEKEIAERSSKVVA
jgi:Na+/melibiose symporter-like transporter